MWHAPFAYKIRNFFKKSLSQNKSANLLYFLTKKSGDFTEFL